MLHMLDEITFVTVGDLATFVGTVEHFLRAEMIDLGFAEVVDLVASMKCPKEVG